MDKCLPRPLSPEDDTRLDGQLRAIGDLPAAALLLTRATGMRIGECIDLTVNSLEHIAADDWALHVPVGKLHSERHVPMDTDARATLRPPTGTPCRLAASPNFLLLAASPKIP